MKSNRVINEGSTCQTATFLAMWTLLALAATPAFAQNVVTPPRNVYRHVDPGSGGPRRHVRERSADSVRPTTPTPSTSDTRLLRRVPPPESQPSYAPRGATPNATRPDTLPRHTPPLHTTTLETNDEASGGRTALPTPSQLSPQSETVPVPTDAASHLDPAYHEFSVTPDQLSSAWWAENVVRKTDGHRQPTPIHLEGLLAATLIYSPYVDVIRELPMIRETSIMEADAAFDWMAYVDAMYSDVSEPVGSTLTTGGANRLRDHNATTSAGIRRKNQYGGQLDIAQRFGHQDTNSVFFVPPNQGTSRLTINYTQPLMRNAGRAYNTALTVLAGIETGAAYDELSEKLQTHLVDVTRAYWMLYLERGNLLQKQKLYAQAVDIQNQLESRRDLDATSTQIKRAWSAVKERQADIVRSRTKIRNAEARIRSLVADPRLGHPLHHELIPQDQPRSTLQEFDLMASLQTAMQNRPELARVVKQIRASGVRLNVAQNELQPALNLILETYASGLRGNSSVGGAWVDQFSTGEPSYSIGLQYEMPIWNRAAESRHRRRRLELKQAEAQMRNTIQNLSLEVEVAVREVITTYREMQANYEAMEAAKLEVENIEDRWQFLAGREKSAALFLDNLLEAQERLNAAEYSFLEAQNKYSLSHVEYLRAIGTLLQAENITLERYCECHLPSVILRHTNDGVELKERLPAPETTIPASDRRQHPQATRRPANATPGQTGPSLAAPVPTRREAQEARHAPVPRARTARHPW